MKKYLYLLICISICFTSACAIDTVDRRNQEREVISSGKYYLVYKGAERQVCYEIYDSKGQVVLSEETDRPLEINMMNDNILDIKIGMGTGIAVHKYYNTRENVFSQEFQYVLSYSDKLVAYIYVPEEMSLKNRKVVVQDIFDKERFYKEFQLEFSNVDTPVVEAIFLNDATSLQLIYLSGEEQRRVSTVLKISPFGERKLEQ